MLRARENHGLSKSLTIDLPVRMEDPSGTSTCCLEDLHDKASAVSALIEREYGSDIIYADDFSRAQHLMTGMNWSPEHDATTWPWPPKASGE